jgi:hypothetical protein
MINKSEELKEKEKEDEDNIKSNSIKTSVFEDYKKIDNLCSLAVDNIESNTIKGNKSIGEIEEVLDYDTMNYFRDSLNNPNIQDKKLIEKMMNLIMVIEKSDSYSIKYKNTVLREMKNRFVIEQEKLNSK